MFKQKIGRALLLLGIAILGALFSWEAFSADVSIVEIRRNIPLSDTDPVYKDFYINGGSDAGLKKNSVLTVYRKLAMRDASGTQNYGELSIPVGQIKIIAIQKGLAVGREHKLISRDDEPMLEQIGIMTGDQVDLASSIIDNKKSSAK